MASASPTPNEIDERRRLAIVQAVDRFDPRQSTAWQQLGSLSPTLELQGHYADREGIVLSGNSFRGVMTLYVLLKYPDGLEASEAFPAFFEGHFAADEDARIDRVDVKTESFFA